MFPSLVNCCTIDWFAEWPAEVHPYSWSVAHPRWPHFRQALYSVGKQQMTLEAVLAIDSGFAVTFQTLAYPGSEACQPWRPDGLLVKVSQAQWDNKKRRLRLRLLKPKASCFEDMRYVWYLTPELPIIQPILEKKTSCLGKACWKSSQWSISPLRRQPRGPWRPSGVGSCGMLDGGKLQLMGCRVSNLELQTPGLHGMNSCQIQHWRNFPSCCWAAATFRFFLNFLGGRFTLRPRLTWSWSHPSRRFWLWDEPGTPMVRDVPFKEIETMHVRLVQHMFTEIPMSTKISQNPVFTWNILESEAGFC